MKESLTERVINSLSDRGRRGKDVAINAKSGAMQVQAYKNEFTKSGSEQMMGRGIIPSQDPGRIPRMGGGYVRGNGKVKSHDYKNGTDGIIIERAINVGDKQRRKKDKGKWWPGDKTEEINKNLFQGRRSVSNRIGAKKRVRRKELTRRYQESQRRNKRMAANLDQATGRRTRSKTEEESRKLEVQLGKGKNIAEEKPDKIILTIQDESEEEFDIRNYIVEEEGSDELGKESRTGEFRRNVKNREVENESPQEAEGGEDDGRRNRRGTRGRGRGRGRGRVGSWGGKGGRGRRRGNEEGETSEPGSRKRSKKNLGRKVQEAEEAYYQDTNPNIRNIIDQMEEEALQEQSEPEMEDWEALLPDPGHTRGRMSLYKQSPHVYWGMKRLLAKAMEQVAMEMAELSQGIPTLKKELKNIQITLLMQDKKMDDIQEMLKAGGLGVKQEKEQGTGKMIQ